MVFSTCFCHETYGAKVKLTRKKRFLPTVNWGKVYENVAGVSTISNQFSNMINQHIIQVIGYVIGGKLWTSMLNKGKINKSAGNNVMTTTASNA